MTELFSYFEYISYFMDNNLSDQGPQGFAQGLVLCQVGCHRNKTQNILPISKYNIKYSPYFKIHEWDVHSRM